VDGNDPLAVVAALTEAVERARGGAGPTLLECVTFRFRGHYFGDPMKYIPAEQLAAAVEADPVPQFRSHLLSAGILSKDDLDEIEAGASLAVEEALAAVMAAPPASLDELDRDVYADPHNCPA
ncbi:MAG: thiamine pyrophosphate-dependent enzyme, partial [Frankia sp.]